MYFQVSTLKSRLKKVSTTTGDGVARAFLKSQASFFGSYRNALKIEPVSRTRVCNIAVNMKLGRSGQKVNVQLSKEWASK